MDGNGRWATQRGISRAEGHEAGVKAAQAIYRRCRQLGIGNLTLYAFSKENWNRPPQEVAFLFSLVAKSFGEAEVAELLALDIRFVLLGDMDHVPQETRQVLETNMARTAHCSSMTLNLAFNYSGREEIVRAARRLVAQGLRPEDIDSDRFAAELYTAGQPDPDLVIRTSGEFRLSNYLLYQSAYAELFFTETLWPDFDANALDAALEDYAGRQRRFGRTGAQLG